MKDKKLTFTVILREEEGYSVQCIELPEGITALIENDEIIRDAVKSHITKEVKDKGLTEEEVMKIDKMIKEGINKSMTYGTNKNDI